MWTERLIKNTSHSFLLVEGEGSGGGAGGGALPCLHTPSSTVIIFLERILFFTCSRLYDRRFFLPAKDDHISL